MGLLGYDMGMDMLSSDPALYEAVCSGDAEGAAASFVSRCAESMQGN